MKYLSREQLIKKTYLQLGNKFNLSKDIIIYLYNLARDDSEIRQYYTNLIYKDTLLIDSSHDNFKNYLPMNQGIEWAIKWNVSKLLNDIHLKIKIIGEKKYLYTNYSYLADGVLQIAIKEAPLKLKLKYLNLSPYEEILEDYIEYLLNDEDFTASLSIDRFGEAYQNDPLHVNPIYNF